MIDTEKYFKLIKRRNSTGKGYYQARFYDSQKNLIQSKSFPVGASKPEVMKAAAEMLESVTPRDDDSDALSYCVSFWSKDSSYFHDKQAKKKTLSESYRRNGESLIKRGIPFLTGKRTGKITTPMLEELEAQLIDEGASIRTARGVIEAIARPVNVYRKKHSRPSLGKIEHGTSDAKTRGTFTLAEIRGVIDSALDDRDKLIFLLGALCGLRKGEMRGLMMSDIDESGLELIVRHNVVFKSEGIKQTKGKESRKVPLPAVVSELIKNVHEKKPGKFVIPNNASPEAPADLSTFRRAFPRILAALDISADEVKRRVLVVHSLRHTYITLIQNIGINPFAAQYLAGHKSQAMTAHYTHASNVIDMKNVGDAINFAVDNA